MASNLTEVEVVAKAIYDAICEERWDELPEGTIERALFRKAADAAIERLDGLRKYRPSR